jgi:hypothetical protein
MVIDGPEDLRSARSRNLRRAGDRRSARPNIRARNLWTHRPSAPGRPRRARDRQSRGRVRAVILEISGPIWTPSSKGSPTFTFFIAATTASLTCLRPSPSTRKRASPRCSPAPCSSSRRSRPSPPTWAGSASSNTMNGALPPSSRCTRFSVSAAVFMIFLPVPVEPVRLTIRTSGCSTIACPASLPPVTMLTTPSGMPASLSQLCEHQRRQRRPGRGLQHDRCSPPRARVRSSTPPS